MGGVTAEKTLAMHKTSKLRSLFNPFHLYSSVLTVPYSIGTEQATLKVRLDFLTWVFFMVANAKN